MWTKWAIGCGMFAVVMAVGAGCGNKGGRNLEPQAFYSPQPTTAPIVETPPVRQPPKPPAPPEEGAAGREGAAPTAPDIEPTSRPSEALGPSEPVARPRPSGGLYYMIVGTVVAEANGKAIYADKVLQKLDAALYAKAVDRQKPYNEQEFRAYASALINKEVNNSIFDELEFAAAQRDNTDEEQQIAAGMTFLWRQRAITHAGGSLAVARQKALQEENMDFDELAMQQYRRWMVFVYYEKHVWPRVQLSANDMRRYYKKNLDKFSEDPSVLFRVIRIGVAETGSRERAAAKAKLIYEKAVKGEDFKALASSTSYNDDRKWAQNGGYQDVVEKLVPVNPDAKEGHPDFGKVKTVREGKWFPKDTLKAMELEAALFAAEKGSVIAPVESGQAFYVAKLEDKKAGSVRGFEDPLVQAQIREVMRGERRRELRDKELQKLIASSVHRKDPQAIETTVDMAMQKYAIWRNEQAKAE